MKRSIATLGLLALSCTMFSRTYIFEDLGTNVEPRGINSLSHISGTLNPGTGTRIAFFWDGVLHQIPLLPNRIYSTGMGLNDSDIVVGWTDPTPNVPGMQVLAWYYRASTGVVTALPGPGSTPSWAYAINNAGVICAQRPPWAFSYSIPSQTYRTWYAPNVTTVQTWAYGINSIGEMTGWASYPSRTLPIPNTEPAAWKVNTVTAVNTNMGYGDYVGRGINTSGTIAGYLQSGTSMTAFYSNGTPVLIGNANASAAYAINDSGEIVGTNDNAAFVYTVAIGRQDLANLLDPLSPPTNGIGLECAYAINSAGAIVGTGTKLLMNGNREQHGWVLWPVP